MQTYVCNLTSTIISKTSKTYKKNCSRKKHDDSMYYCTSLLYCCNTKHKYKTDFTLNYFSTHHLTEVTQVSESYMNKGNYNYYKTADADQNR